MKVFVSWSGPKSNAVANLLRTWLPAVVQAVEEVWLSEEDIRSGANWSATIGEKLSATDFGIVCVTEENQDRPWLNFEAGAISKLVGGAIPLLIDFKSKGDLKSGPMSQLQVRLPDRTDMERLVRDVNVATGNPRSPEVLKTAFDAMWPTFEQGFETILEEHPHVYDLTKPARTDSDKIDELLQLAREQGRVSASELAELREQVRDLEIAMPLPNTPFGRAAEAYARRAGRISVTGTYQRLAQRDQIAEMDAVIGDVLSTNFGLSRAAAYVELMPNGAFGLVTPHSIAATATAALLQALATGFPRERFEGPIFTTGQLRLSDEFPEEFAGVRPGDDHEDEGGEQPRAAGHDPH